MIGCIELLDSGGLNSIVAAPKQVFLEKRHIQLFGLKLHIICKKLQKKYVFADGNKRTAMESARLFLLLNGYDLKTHADELGRLTLYVTNSPDSEQVMLKTVKYFKKHSTEL